MGVFACLVATTVEGQSLDEFSAAWSEPFSKTSVAVTHALVIYSMAGVPPLAGFLPKLLMLGHAVHHGLWELSCVAIFASVIGTFNYVRVIKGLLFLDKDHLGLHVYSPITPCSCN